MEYKIYNASLQISKPPYEISELMNILRYVFEEYEFEKEYE